MGFLDRLLGREPSRNAAGHGSPTPQGSAGGGPAAGASTGPQDSMTGATAADRQAIARYRYLLRTAPPEQIEEAHAQAFAQLSPAQRQQVLQEMTQTLPAGEQPTSDDPRQLARAATRAEMQQPGYLQRTFGGRGYAGGMGGGGMMGSFGGSLLGTVAGVVIGTAVADAMMGGFDSSPEQQEFAADGGDQGGSGDSAGSDGTGGIDGTGDPGTGADTAAYDSSDPGPTGDTGVSGDTGTGDGGWGGDSGWGGGGDSGFGGGDFGGGDFGGGDF